MSSIPSQTPRSFGLRALALAASLSLAACVVDAAQDVDDGEGVTRLLQPLTQSVTFVDVTASGSGCPPGTWLTSLSPDGQVFTTTFSAYETEVGPQASVSTKDCALSMKLRSAAATSLTVASVYHAGYTYLEDRVSLRHSVRYGFHGSGADAGHGKTEIVGPYDDDFLVEDEVSLAKQRWSPCGAEHTLTASTQLRLQRGPKKGTGYANMSATDGSLQLVFRLATRACTSGTKKGNAAR